MNHWPYTAHKSFHLHSTHLEVTFTCQLHSPSKIQLKCCPVNCGKWYTGKIISPNSGLNALQLRIPFRGQSLGLLSLLWHFYCLKRMRHYLPKPVELLPLELITYQVLILTSILISKTHNQGLYSTFVLRACLKEGSSPTEAVTPGEAQAAHLTAGW